MRKRLASVGRPHFGPHYRGSTAVAQPILRTLAVALLVSLLALQLTACEGGYTTRGERSSMTQSGDRGEIDVRIDSASGSATKGAEFDCAGCIVEVDVTLQVEQGKFKLEFLGEDEEVTLTLEASGGQQVTGSGYMVTDSFGEGEYRVTAEEARGVSYNITYQIR